MAPAVAVTGGVSRRRRRRRPAAVPAGAEPALQRPGRLREPAAGARARQGGERGRAGERGSGRGARLTTLVPQAVVKALEQLAQQGRIREKAYGKQKIYFADQVSPGPGRCPRGDRPPLTPCLAAGAAPGRQRRGAPQPGWGDRRALHQVAGAAAELPANGDG